MTEDMVGMFGTFTPKFAKRYAELGEQLGEVAATYAEEVRARSFPGPEHCFDAAPAAAALKKNG